LDVSASLFFLYHANTTPSWFVCEKVAPNGTTSLYRTMSYHFGLSVSFAYVPESPFAVLKSLSITLHDGTDALLLLRPLFSAEFPDRITYCILSLPRDSRQSALQNHPDSG
jgi:hypothetical protein